jgi:mono/diheme cytochrome c family protein
MGHHRWMRGYAALTLFLLLTVGALAGSCGDEGGGTVLEPDTTIGLTDTTGDALTDPGTIDEGGTTETTDEQGRLVAGAHAYAQLCSGCHGPEGQGGVGPELSGRASREDQVRDRIRRAHQGDPELATLTGEDLDNISFYVAERFAR